MVRVMRNLPTNFLTALVDTYTTLTGRGPRLFEQATADILEIAYKAATEDRPRAYFETVSGATGGGKTKAAEALIHYVLPDPVTFVIKEIREIDDVYLDLKRLLSDDFSVAMFDSIHRVGAQAHLVREKEFDLGRSLAGQFTIDECTDAHVLITTHDQWRQAVDGKKDKQFVLRRHGQDVLVIVDEDPELERTYIAQPHNVSELIGVLSDVEESNEARAYGFTNLHHLVPTLKAIYGRMERIKIEREGLVKYTKEPFITDREADCLMTLSDGDISRRVADLRGKPDQLERLRETVKFLQAACEGRVFYAQDESPAFHAYSMSIPAQHNTIILDGTADLNSLFAVSEHVHVLDESLQPNYGPAKLYFIVPPSHLRGKMKPLMLLKNQWSAAPIMEWLFEDFMLEHTVPGDRILVYAKKDLLNFNIQANYDESINTHPMYVEYKGREIHFCNFGAGRGSNRWKSCNVCVRLTEFYPRKAEMLKKAASMSGTTLSSADLKDASGGRTRFELFQSARRTHLMVHNKQETARICIRELDDYGVCQPARLYFIDTEMLLLQKYQQRMYPGSGPITYINHAGPSDTDTTSELLLDFCRAASSGSVFTYRELAKHVKTTPKLTAQAIYRNWKALKADGYIQSTEKAERGSGRGKCIVKKLKTSLSIVSL